MEFLDFLFIAILVLYIVRSLARIILPRVFQNVMNKAQQQHSQQQNYNNNANQYNSNTNQGKIRVDYKPASKKGSVPDSEGEFIDYEEIK
jgi:uncharacterized protein DUF4834